MVVLFILVNALPHHCQAKARSERLFMRVDVKKTLGVVAHHMHITSTSLERRTAQRGENGATQAHLDANSDAHLSLSIDKRFSHRNAFTTSEMSLHPIRRACCCDQPSMRSQHFYADREIALLKVDAGNPIVKSSHTELTVQYRIR
eukprot:SAG11_NODE_994_length_6261_cov_10.558747_2_plen_146_part_00